jgi:hypothetical protein
MFYTYNMPYLITDQCELDFPEPKKVRDRDGCVCKKCDVFCPMAEDNQSDGSFICYKCRKGY